MKEPEYIKLTNQKADVEGIPSVFRRRYKIDTMSIRGLVRRYYMQIKKIAKAY
ncbi:hypothetical protein [Caloranaerobacter sp. DY30410]|uniref:hypothetical protein n=1 Tax=Caloranaerobacter sp. DY30410 TaxID=3238305 RepID=UPI003D024C2C